MEPFDVDEIHTRDVSFEDNFNEKVLSADIIKILNQHIPVSIRSDYRRFIDGVKLPKNKRDNLIENIKKILSEHYEWRREDENGQA